MAALRWATMTAHHPHWTQCAFCRQALRADDLVHAVITRGLNSVPVHDTCLQDPGCLAALGAREPQPDTVSILRRVEAVA